MRSRQPVRLKVAAGQFRSSFRVAENRDRMPAVPERLARDRVAVAVFPECALTGYDKDSLRAPTSIWFRLLRKP